MVSMVSKMLGFSYCAEFEFLGIGAEQGSGWTLEAILDAFRATNVGLILTLGFHS